MESLHYLLMKSHALVSRRVLAQAAQMGLTPGQPKVLDFLLLHEEADQKTIAAYCEIQQATVGSILLRMEQAGLILRRRREGNRRSLYVSLTQKGQEAAVTMADIFRAAEEEAVRGFSPEERESLLCLLCRVCCQMGADPHRGEG